MKNIITGAGLSIILAAGSVSAQEEKISNVRKAAIKKMQSRLGSLRGSIKEDSVDIFLTEDMIDHLRQVRPGDHIEAIQKTPKNLLPRSIIKTRDIQTVPAPQKKQTSSLYEAAGYKTENKS